MGWNNHGCGSEFLDPALEWDCIIDDPLGDRTNRPSVLTDQIYCGDLRAKMKQAIVQATKVMGDRLGSMEQDAARAIQDLKASMQGASEPSLSVKIVREPSSQTPQATQVTIERPLCSVIPRHICLSDDNYADEEVFYLSELRP